MDVPLSAVWKGFEEEWGREKARAERYKKALEEIAADGDALGEFRHEAIAIARRALEEK